MSKPALHIFLIAVGLLRIPCANGFDFEAFQKLVVFGDSLSDNGNSFVATGMPPAPYFDGRWTNGPNWVDYFPLVTRHFLPATAFLKDGGTNFAVGGSPSTNLATEIGAFLLSTGGMPPQMIFTLSGLAGTISAIESIQTSPSRTLWPESDCFGKRAPGSLC